MSLIERELRRGMEQAGLAEPPLYPEQRTCRGMISTDFRRGDNRHLA